MGSALMQQETTESVFLIADAGSAILPLGGAQTSSRWRQHCTWYGLVKGVQILHPLNHGEPSLYNGGPRRPQRLRLDLPDALSAFSVSPGRRDRRSGQSMRMIRKMGAAAAAITVAVPGVIGSPLLQGTARGLRSVSRVGLEC